MTDDRKPRGERAGKNKPGSYAPRYASKGKPAERAGGAKKNASFSRKPAPKGESARADTRAFTERRAPAGKEASAERQAPVYKEEEKDESVLEGRNPILEALKAGYPIDKLFIRKSDGKENDPIAARIVAMAREQGAAVVECDRRMLDRMSVTRAHQGVIAHAAAAKYAEISDIVEAARQSGRPGLIVVCDGLSDPGNLGAVIRSAEVAGAHGVIIPRRRSAGLTPSVSKAAAGALSYLPVARCANIAAALKELKEAGYWIFGADASGEKLLYDADFSLPAALVIGSEGGGMSRLVGETCDFTVKIPMSGHINSLNASAAAAVLLFEVVRQRTSKT